MPTFEKLRASLARGDEPPALAAIGHDDGHRSRHDFLVAAFAKEVAFIHERTGKRMDFIPLDIDGNYVAGIFRRQAPVSLHDESLRPYDAENYEGAVVIISTGKDQITWMQHNPKVGSTKSLLESFFNYLSRKTDVKDWTVYVEYFHDEREYRSVIRQKREKIAKITFTFIPPRVRTH